MVNPSLRRARRRHRLPRRPRGKARRGAPIGHVRPGSTAAGRLQRELSPRAPRVRVPAGPVGRQATVVRSAGCAGPGSTPGAGPASCDAARGGCRDPPTGRRPLPGVRLLRQGEFKKSRKQLIENELRVLGCSSFPRRLPLPARESTGPSEPPADRGPRPRGPAEPRRARGAAETRRNSETRNRPVPQFSLTASRRGRRASGYTCGDPVGQSASRPRFCGRQCMVQLAAFAAEQPLLEHLMTVDASRPVVIAAGVGHRGQPRTAAGLGLPVAAESAHPAAEDATGPLDSPHAAHHPPAECGR